MKTADVLTRPGCGYLKEKTWKNQRHDVLPLFWKNPEIDSPRRTMPAKKSEGLIPIDYGYDTKKIYPFADIIAFGLKDAHKNLPRIFAHITEAIKKSEYIYSLKDDWDDNGSPGYNKKTWDRAVDFIAYYAYQIYDTESVIVDKPLIYEGPQGSIDIIWENENHRVGINVPSDERIPVSFYGDDRNKDSEKGTISEASKIKRGLVDILVNLSK